MSRLAFVGLFVSLPVLAAEPVKPVNAVVESSLKTAGRQIRQFAFDGDGDTMFVSDGNPGKDDHFTLTFDKSVKLKSVELTTGRLNSEDVLVSGRLQISTDGKEFRDYATLAAGKSSGGKTTTIIQAPAGKLPRPSSRHPHPARRIEASAGDPRDQDRFRSAGRQVSVPR